MVRDVMCCSTLYLVCNPMYHSHRPIPDASDNHLVSTALSYGRHHFSNWILILLHPSIDGAPLHITIVFVTNGLIVLVSGAWCVQLVMLSQLPDSRLSRKAGTHQAMIKLGHRTPLTVFLRLGG